MGAVVIFDLIANRPAADAYNARFFFVATDEDPTTYVSDGSTWTTVGGSGSGTVTEITSTDLSVTITDPTGPIVDLSVEFPPSTGIAFATEPQLGDWLDIETDGLDGDGFGFHYTADHSGDADDALVRWTLTADSGQATFQVDSSSESQQVFGIRSVATGDTDTVHAFTGSATADGDSALFIDGQAEVTAGGGSAVGINVNALAVDGETIGVETVAIASGAGAATGLIGQGITGAGSGAIAMGAKANADSSSGTGLAQGLLAQAGSADGDAVGVDVTAAASGTGDVIGLRVQCSADGSGTVKEVQVLDSGDNPIFEVRDDGSVHILAGALSSAPAASAASTLALGTAYQNTLGYDVILTIYLSITVNAGGSISLGIGPTSTPTQQVLITGLTALGIVPIPIYLPDQYYALLSISGLTAAINGQIAMPV